MTAHHPCAPGSRFRALTIGVALSATALAASNVIAQSAANLSQHTFFHVSLDSSFSAPVAGRLLLFIAPASGDGSQVDINMMSPESVYVAAKEVPRLAQGESVDIDADDVVFPRPVSQTAAGNYRVQAVLDVAHNYNYKGRAPGDVISAPVAVELPFSASPTLTLAKVVPDTPDPLEGRPDVDSALKPLDFISPVLTKFWGREIHMRGWVLLPPRNVSTIMRQVASEFSVDRPLSRWL